MEASVHEIANGIYRISTFVPEVAAPVGFTFNQFLVLGDEPLLFHTGPRRMFPIVRAAVATVMAPEALRWITFGHVEADECGSMNDWLAIAPHAQVAHGATGCSVQLADLADRPAVLARYAHERARLHRRVRRDATPIRHRILRFQHSNP